jgi:predicted RNase H-like nuclease (RuvC/YqgF family)
MEAEKTRLKDVAPYIILDYIRSSFEIILDIKKEEAKEEIANSNPPETPTSKGPPKDYEIMLQKLEEEIRNHIRVEQQLKILVETSQSELEDSEKEIKSLKAKIKLMQVESTQLKEGHRTKDCEITQLKEQILGKEKQIESLADNKTHNKSTYDDVVTVENNSHNKSMIDPRTSIEMCPTRNGNMPDGKAICKTHKGSLDFHKGIRTISHERNRTKLSNDYQK